jgi:hypothetical protein
MNRLLIPVFAAAAALSACDRTPPAAGRQPPAALPAGMVLASAPADARPVLEAKADAQPGQPITLRGRIGGSEHPFTPGRAVFTIVDPSMPACSDNPTDSCNTPWDYCCEDPSDLRRHSATIQLVGPDGQPLKVDIQGLSGLTPLAEVFITGTVRAREGDAVFIVDATGVYAQPWRKP